MFVSAADQPVNEQDTRFALAVVELQVSTLHTNISVIGVKFEFFIKETSGIVIKISIGHLCLQVSFSVH